MNISKSPTNSCLIIIGCLFLLGYLFTGNYSSAEEPKKKETQDMEEILSGFDDMGNPGAKTKERDGKEEASREVEDALSGFHDMPGVDAKPGQGEAVEDVLSGFDDMREAGSERVESELEETPWWSLDGFLRMDASYNYSHDAPGPSDPDYRGLSKLRTTLHMEVPVTFPNKWKGFVSGQVNYDYSYLIKDRYGFSGEVLDLYEQDAELRELYLAGSPLSNLDVKIGRQIVVWGFADYIRAVDVLNPFDNREPGLIDIEDLRLPVGMSRLDYYFGDWRLMGVAVHEIFFNKDPVYNSDFYPSHQPPPSARKPSTGFKNTEFGISLTGAFHGWDIGFYYAHYFDDIPYVDVQGASMSLQYPSINMGGAAINFVYESWLFKAEAAFKDGYRFTNRPGETFSRIDSTIGVEYSGIVDTNITLEILNQHINDFDPSLERSPDYARQDLTQYLVTYRWDFMRQRLHLIALATLVTSAGVYQGNIQRYSVGYDLVDAFTLTFGILNFYRGKDYIVTDVYKDNDRLFFEAKYNF